MKLKVMIARLRRAFLAVPGACERLDWLHNRLNDPGVNALEDEGGSEQDPPPQPPNT